MKLSPPPLVLLCIISAIVCVPMTNDCNAQSLSRGTALGDNNPPAVGLDVSQTNGSVELISGSSKRLKFDTPIPELLVENPEVISANPVSPSEILVTGLKPGISNITVIDANQQLQVLKIDVVVDVRKLQNALDQHFPNSKITAAALNTSVLLKGNVARADQVKNVIAVAQDYFPTNVINELQVTGSQNVAIKVKVYEVSRSKFRELGVDWALLSGNVNVVSSVSELISSFSGNAVTAADSTINLGVLDNSNSFNAVIRALERHNVAKLLDQPVLVAQNGRPAEFLSGGEIPIQVQSGLGNVSLQFRPFGTKLDLVPIIHGQGQLTLEVRAEVSEVAPDLASGTGVPGFRVRRVNTGVKMKAGHTLALAGDYQKTSTSSKQGIPKLMHNTIFGAPFRRNSVDEQETELVFLITPRFISEVDPSLVSQPNVGELTTIPSDRQLFADGHLEVPACGPDCQAVDQFNVPPVSRHQSAGYTGIPGQQYIPQQVLPGTPGGYPAVPPQPGLGGSTSRSMVPSLPKLKMPWSKDVVAQPRQASSVNGFAWPTSERR